MCSKQLKKSGSLVLALAPECQWVTLYNERTVAAGHRVRIHVSVFVTSQEKKFILSTESPGDHVPQGSVPVFKTGFFFLRNPNTDFKTSGTQSSFLRNRCNFCFSLTKHPLFFVSSYSLDFIIDSLSTFAHSFTPARKEQLTRWCRPSFANVLFLCCPIKHRTAVLSSNFCSVCYSAGN